MAAGRSLLRLPLATVHNYLHGYGRRGRTDDWSRELLAFHLGEERYAVDLLRMREIVTRREVTEVPRTPAFLLGVFSLRGQIVPVVDLRRRLGLPPVAPTRATRYLIVNGGGDLFGLVVDGVRGVVRLGDEAIENRPPALAGRDREYIEAIARPPGGGLVVLLALDQVLSFSVHKRRDGREVPR
jgi:purine-binding chemotaxis protein CheW